MAPRKVRPMRASAATALCLLAGLALSACGSSGDSNNTTTAASLGTAGVQSPLSESLTNGRRGGTLQVLQETDFENLDPGRSYYGIDYEVVYATQRPLYSDKPNSTEPTPDMAAGAPRVSADGKTITIALKRGIRFSPPVNREVTSQDVAYAIERGANPNVANPYFHSYFVSIVGAPTADGSPIAGIQTPDSHTIVFHLSEAKAPIVIDALGLPLSAPVPRSYAEKLDRAKPSAYAAHEVATGPYMLKNDKAGKVLGIGYIPGRSATLVRNPNWRAATDFRPAYLDRIDIKIGGAQAIIGRQVLEGKNLLENEPTAQSIVKLAYQQHRGQLEISPGAGSHYIALNNKVGPFSNIDLRKALWAALDREALDKARGGALVTSVATHFIYPTIPGFDQAGGLKGPSGSRFDFDQHPEGSMAVAKKYMKLAGYPGGRYTGAKTLTVVGSKGEPTEQDAEIVNHTLNQLGFTTNFNLVESATMYAKYCSVPKEEISVCPNVAWTADFPDPQAVLDITFNGKLIGPTGNANWSQTDVPAINAAMTAAESVSGRNARAAAWGKIDTELVADATAIPFDWDKQALVEGSGVAGVGDIWDVGEWDYSFTSLR
jgi:peptide/nickel transport system substrate-binding protein